MYRLSRCAESTDVVDEIEEAVLDQFGGREERM